MAWTCGLGARRPDQFGSDLNIILFVMSFIMNSHVMRLSNK